MREIVETEAGLRRLLRHHQINPTRQRINIARVLFAQLGHLSADAVYTSVNGAHPCTSKATVYNTLKLFVRCGLLREVFADPSKVFYDVNTAPHYHFYDLDTGELIDIPPENLPVARLPQLPDGKVTEGVDIVVRIRARSVD